MHDHLDEGDGADAYMLEVVWVIFPGLCGIYFGLAVVGVVVKGVSYGIDELDVVIELYAGLFVSIIF